MKWVDKLIDESNWEVKVDWMEGLGAETHNQQPATTAASSEWRGKPIETIQSIHFSTN